MAKPKDSDTQAETADDQAPAVNERGHHSMPRIAMKALKDFQHDISGLAVKAGEELHEQTNWADRLYRQRRADYVDPQDHPANREKRLQATRPTN